MRGTPPWSHKCSPGRHRIESPAAYARRISDRRPSPVFPSGEAIQVRPVAGACESPRITRLAMNQPARRHHPSVRDVHCMPWNEANPTEVLGWRLACIIAFTLSSSSSRCDARIVSDQSSLKPRLTELRVTSADSRSTPKRSRLDRRSVPRIAPPPARINNNSVRATRVARNFEGWHSASPW